eukprot:4724938-Prymnesium_polylepis.1
MHREVRRAVVQHPSRQGGQAFAAAGCARRAGPKSKRASATLSPVGGRQAHTPVRRQRKGRTLPLVLAHRYPNRHGRASSTQPRIGSSALCSVPHHLSGPRRTACELCSPRDALLQQKVEPQRKSLQARCLCQASTIHYSPSQGKLRQGIQCVRVQRDLPLGAGGHPQSVNGTLQHRCCQKRASEQTGARLGAT